jgi:hypothetical protein
VGDHPLLVRPAGHGLEVVPGGQHPAQVALGQLDQQRAGRNPHRFQVIQGHQPEAVADQLPVQAVQQAVAAFLVNFQVTGRVERHGRVAAALGPDAQRDLLGHRPRREKKARLLAEQPGHFGLEVRNQAPAAVDVGVQIGGRAGGQIGQDLLRLAEIVSRYETGTTGAHGLRALLAFFRGSLGGHRRLLPANRPDQKGMGHG